MGSTALAGWFGVRTERLDELVGMHQRATGSSPGRRYGTSEFNRTLVTALGSFRRHRSTLNGLARTLDRVLAAQLADLLGTDPPW